MNRLALLGVEVAFSSPLITEETLREGSRSSRSSIRRLTAGHSSTPVSSLEALAQDSDLRVKTTLGRNPSASSRVYDILAGDPGILTHYYGTMGSRRAPEQRPQWLVERAGTLAPRDKLGRIILQSMFALTFVFAYSLSSNWDVLGVGGSLILGAILSGAMGIGVWYYTGSDGD